LLASLVADLVVALRGPDLCPQPAGASQQLRGYGRFPPGQRDSRVDLDASVSLERLAECAPVLREHVGVLLPELVQEPRRALDVGEEKGDRS
jgi:hypothetical protein